MLVRLVVFLGNLSSIPLSNKPQLEYRPDETMPDSDFGACACRIPPWVFGLVCYVMQFAIKSLSPSLC